MKSVYRSVSIARKILPAVLVLLPFREASAHHLMDGNVPATFMDGLLSGLAHPVIGPDHLAFVVAIGLLSLRFPRGVLLPLAFLATGWAGTALHLNAVDLPAPEISVALSVLLFGLLLAFPAHLPLPGLTAAAALAGVAHGYAYGESIVGAEAAPLGAYLIGFTVIQLILAMATRSLARAAAAAHPSRRRAVERLAGLGAGCIGLFFLFAVGRA